MTEILSDDAKAMALAVLAAWGEDGIVPKLAASAPIEKPCDFCGRPAWIDGPMRGGRWGYACPTCAALFCIPSGIATRLVATS